MQPFRNWLGQALLPCAVLVAIAALTQHAYAQLSSAQQSALKANCRSDFMAHCSTESPGTKGALVCLQKNVASLSPGCKSAVSATLPPPPAAAKAPPPAAAPKPAAAAAPPPKAASPASSTAQADALNHACGNDYLAHCANVVPGGKEAVVCLRQHAMQLSVPCKEVLSKMMAPPSAPPPKKVVVHTAPPPATMSPPPAAVAAGPTPEQMKAVKFTCRSDFRAHCRGVPTGGQEAMACLMRNSARLTPDCRTSVRAIEASMGGAPAAAATAAPGQPTPEQQAALKQNCSGDFPRVCPGVSPGPSALTCLQTHAAELSPACKASVAALNGGAAPAPAAAATPARHLPPGVTPVGRILRRVMEHNR